MEWEGFEILSEREKIKSKSRWAHSISINPIMSGGDKSPNKIEHVTKQLSLEDRNPDMRALQN